VKPIVALAKLFNWLVADVQTIHFATLSFSIHKLEREHPMGIFFFHDKTIA
jgi:hypothetical protein